MLKQNPGFLFNVYLDKRWEFIAIFRRFVSGLVYELFKNEDRAKKIELAIHELIENSMRYSPEGSDIHVNAKEKKNCIIFQIRNFPLEKKRGDVFEYLKKELGELNKMDPKEAYLQKLAATQEDINAELHLGLARIRYETNADLEIETNEQNLIIITSTFYHDDE